MNSRPPTIIRYNRLTPNQTRHEIPQLTSNEVSQDFIFVIKDIRNDVLVEQLSRIFKNEATFEFNDIQNDEAAKKIADALCHPKTYFALNTITTFYNISFYEISPRQMQIIANGLKNVRNTLSGLHVSLSSESLDILLSHVPEGFLKEIHLTSLDNQIIAVLVKHLTERQLPLSIIKLNKNIKPSFVDMLLRELQTKLKDKKINTLILPLDFPEHVKQAFAALQQFTVKTEYARDHKNDSSAAGNATRKRPSSDMKNETDGTANKKIKTAETQASLPSSAASSSSTTPTVEKEKTKVKPEPRMEGADFSTAAASSVAVTLPAQPPTLSATPSTPSSRHTFQILQYLAASPSAASAATPIAKTPVVATAYVSATPGTVTVPLAQSSNSSSSSSSTPKTFAPANNQLLLEVNNLKLQCSKLINEIKKTARESKQWQNSYVDLHKDAIAIKASAETLKTENEDWFKRWDQLYTSLHDLFEPGVCQRVGLNAAAEPPIRATVPYVPILFSLQNFTDETSMVREINHLNMEIKRLTEEITRHQKQSNHFENKFNLLLFHLNIILSKENKVNRTKTFGSDTASEWAERYRVLLKGLQAGITSAEKMGEPTQNVSTAAASTFATSSSFSSSSAGTSTYPRPY